MTTWWTKINPEKGIEPVTAVVPDDIREHADFDYTCWCGPLAEVYHGHYILIHHPKSKAYFS